MPVGASWTELIGILLQQWVACAYDGLDMGFQGLEERKATRCVLHVTDRGRIRLVGLLQSTSGLSAEGSYR